MGLIAQRRGGHQANDHQPRGAAKGEHYTAKFQRSDALVDLQGYRKRLCALVADLVTCVRGGNGIPGGDRVWAWRGQWRVLRYVSHSRVANKSIDAETDVRIHHKAVVKNKRKTKKKSETNEKNLIPPPPVMRARTFTRPQVRTRRGLLSELWIK